MEENSEKAHISTDNGHTKYIECSFSSTFQIDEKAYAKWLKEHTYISGMMSAMMFIIIMTGLGGLVFSLIFYNNDDIINPFIWVAEIVIGFISFCIAGYTFYTFLQRKPNAVFWGYSFIAQSFLSSLFYCQYFIKETSLENIKNIIISLAWYLGLIIYLNISPKIKEVIPPSYRRVTEFDWTVITISISLPTILMIIGLIQIC